VSAVRLTHVGGPTVLIETGGWRLLTDPTFDDPGRRYAFGWGTLSRKLTGPAIPVHYEGWRHFKQGREAIEREFARAPDDVRARLRWLPIGAGVEI
jgi:hypothetical protein